MPDNWQEMNNWNAGGILFPNFHLHGVGGFTQDDPGNWQEGEHDPKRSSFSAHAIEPGVSLRTEYLQGFTNYFFFQDEEGGWDGEWEEGFLKLHNLPGGKALRWRTEYLWRHVDARAEDEGVVTTGTFGETGIHTHLIAIWKQRLDTGLRVAWIEGLPELGLDERYRISPMVTWFLEDTRRLSVRVQSNHDWIPGGEQNHAVWFQFNIALGDLNEVR